MHSLVVRLLFIQNKITILLLLLYIFLIFTLGFIGKYVLGYSTEECVKSGINAGSYIIQRPGMSKGESFNI